MEKLELLLEAERRGILPPEQQVLLDEARTRGLVPQKAEPVVQAPVQESYQVGPAPTAAALLASQVPSLNIGQFDRAYEKERTGIDMPVITQGMVDESYGPNAKKFDLQNSMISGIGEFGAGIASMPETVPGLVDAGVNYFTGIVPPRPEPGLLTQAADAITAPIQHDPQTSVGEVFHKAGEYGFPLTGPLGFTMGAADEFAGDATEYLSGDDKYRDAVGLVAALFGPSAANKMLKAGTKVITPAGKIKPKVVRANSILDDAGIKQTAGQMTRDKSLMKLEATSPRLQALADNQADDFTAAVLKKVKPGHRGSLDVDDLDDVITTMQDKIGATFNKVATDTKNLKVTRAQVAEIGQLADDYITSAGTNIGFPKELSKELDELARLTNADALLPAEKYMKYWSTLGKHTKSQDAFMREFAVKARTILNDALQASATPENAKKLARARLDWGRSIAMERASRNADGAIDVLNAKSLRSAIQKYDKKFRKLANAGVAGLKPLPAGSTATGIQKLQKAVRPFALTGGAGAGLGYLLGGPVGAGVGSAAGMGAVAGLEGLGAAKRAFKLSPMGQRYLANQALTEAPQIGGSTFMKALLAGNEATGGGDKLMEMFRGYQP